MRDFWKVNRETKSGETHSAVGGIGPHELLLESYAQHSALAVADGWRLEYCWSQAVQVDPLRQCDAPTMNVRIGVQKIR